MFIKNLPSYQLGKCVSKSGKLYKTFWFLTQNLIRAKFTFLLSYILINISLPLCFFLFARRSRLHVYKIWTGVVDSIKFNSRVETFSLKDMIIHEHYNSKTYQNDIALLEMKTKNEGTPCSPPDTVPVCIPWSQYMFGGGHQCKVSGWGLDEGN